MIIRMGCQCIYVPPYVFPSVSCHAIILGKDERSIVDKTRLTSYFLGIKGHGININSTLYFLSFEQDSINIFLEDLDNFMEVEV